MSHQGVGGGKPLIQLTSVFPTYFPQTSLGTWVSQRVGIIEQLYPDIIHWQKMESFAVIHGTMALTLIDGMSEDKDVLRHKLEEWGGNPEFNAANAISEPQDESRLT